MQTVCTDLALLTLVFLGEGVQVEPAAKFPGHNVPTVPPLEIAVKICRDVARLRASGLHLTNPPPPHYSSHTHNTLFYPTWFQTFKKF